MKVYTISVAGGCAIGFVSTLLFNFLINMFPDLRPVAISVLSQILGMEVYNPIHYTIIIYLCFIAPLAEEYIFRGIFWDLTEKIFNKNTAYFFTTALFCLAHVEPLHIISILPLSIFFGWLRYRYNTMKLSILSHVVNNIIATILLIC